MTGNIWLPIAVFSFTSVLLIMVQLKVENPMLLMERFIQGGGWIEIFMVAGYGALVAHKMQDPAKVQKWRKYTWFAFSVFFFLQLALGLMGADRFLMTGELHLPVPMMILAGPVYRGHISVMTILFLSTVLLSGPAWCSHICYFGAIDSMGSGGKTGRGPIRGKWLFKSTLLLLVIAAAIVLRWSGLPTLTSTLIAAGFGVMGLAIILLISRKQGRMVHCTVYCPIGTIVNFIRFVNPFRMRIDHNTCTDCMACTRLCKYDALNRSDIAARKPGLTCTLCGDCITGCHSGSIHYRFFRLPPAAARNFYLFITISLYASTLALARI